ncbi:MAG: 4-hydroxythreonine-4-phosphate dehydrogenase PdxA [Deltaproteobacteria bacterium]|nr:4-hydroxythreonine-4-phosphate dehydrogenase PdxA [Deltaproteobacteria bacterium]
MSAIIGVTMGHPSGVGPEILIKSAVKFIKKNRNVSILIFGNRKVLDFYSSILEEGRDFTELTKSQRIGISDIGNLKDDDFQPGKPSEQGNIAQIEFIKEATRNINTYKLSAIVTMPISKLGLLREGIDIPGHTDLFKKLFNVRFVQMLFQMKRMPLVALNTTHIPLAQVPKALSREDILRNLRMLNFAMKNLFGIKEPNIAVCGLNPHAGEGGLLGKEEKEIIAPAVESAREENINANGPFASDSVFYRAFKGRYNAILAMYHDQALIPVKLFGISEAVNITLGLPLIRTSPAHGTAFEIAGKSQAESEGAFRALETAYKISKRFPGNIAWNT